MVKFLKDREFNPEWKASIKDKKDKTCKWVVDHKDGIDAGTSVLKFAASAGAVGGLFHKAKKVVSKD